MDDNYKRWMRRILVPLDGSEIAEQVIPFALGLARDLNVPVHLVRVADPSVVLDDHHPSTPEQAHVAIIAAEDMASEYLAIVQACLAAAGRTVTSELRRGNTTRQIITVAGTHDLIIVSGCGGTSAANVPALVAADVVSHSRALVLVIPVDVASRARPPPIGHDLP